MGRYGSESTHAENSVEGCLAALGAGAEGIEFDVRLSSDNHVIVHHDSSLGRATTLSAAEGVSQVERLSTADLTGVQLLPPGSGAISTLPELLDAVSLVLGEREMWVELKYPVSIENSQTLVRRVIEVVADYPVWSNLWFISFSCGLLSIVRHLRPDAKVILLGRARIFQTISLAAQAGFDGVGIFHHFARWPIPKMVRRQGLRLIVGTANDRRSVRRLLDSGVDAISTDRLDVALPLI